MLEYKFDTQLLIERTTADLNEDAINDYIRTNIEGDCLIAAGDEDLVKVHFHTNTPWKVLEYCSSLGDLFDVVVENMERQENGLQG
ncbi:MAG: kinase to dihydroxyacetone kinase [Acutalibacteraceae bacterium]